MDTGLRFGWIDTSIGGLLEVQPSVLSRFPYVLVSVLDSVTNLPSSEIGKVILRRSASSQVLGRGIVVPTIDFQAIAATHNLLCGFDELWCFRREPVVDKPEDVSMLAPLNLSMESMPAATAEWMTSSECGLGLGDGEGLNYVTPDEATAALLKQRGI